MLLTQMDYFEEYLSESDIIDFQNSEVLRMAEKLRVISSSQIELVKNTYEFVRDNISHSADKHKDITQSSVLPFTASEVLLHNEGICFAKSNLLAALLRLNKIPAGFCYQRLILSDEKPHLVLHGLNAVFIFDRWIRLDARGNKPGVEAQFTTGREILAFNVHPKKGEQDLPGIYAYPDKNVIEAFGNCKTFDELWANLPTDIS